MRNIKLSKSSMSAKRGFIKSGLFKNSNIKIALLFKETIELKSKNLNIKINTFWHLFKFRIFVRMINTYKTYQRL